MKNANINAKNVRKVLVSVFDKKHTMMVPCDDKCAVKIGSPRVTLDLCHKTKVGWVSKDVDVSAADHDAVIKSTVVPSVMLDIDIPSNHDLGSFYKGDIHVVTKDSSVHPTSDIR